MSQYTSYYLYEKYEQRSGGEPVPCYPNEFSIDGDGTQTVHIKKENDEECGYYPPVEPIYRWYQLPIATDYVCAECPELQYRWEKAATTDYICVGVDKHYKEYYQVSYDGGETWQNVIPEQTRTSSDVIEYNSEDCGYVPPTPPSDGFEVLSYNIIDSRKSEFNIKSIYNGEFNRWSVTYSGQPYNIQITKTNDTLKLKFLDRPMSDIAYYVGIANVHGCKIDINMLVHVGQTNLCQVASINQTCGTPSTDMKFRAAYSGGQTYESLYDGNPTLASGNTKPSNYQYTAMTSAVIGDCVNYIGGDAFSYCSSLTSVIIPSSVTSIGRDAFRSCTSLTSVTIPNGMILIRDGAFASCSRLTSITVQATTPPTLTNYSAFSSTNNCPIYVPSGSVEAYKTATNWSTYADRIQAIS